MNNPFVPGVFSCVVSSGRAANTVAMGRLCGPCTWVVPAGQKQAYLDAGAPAVVGVAKPSTGSQLVAQRNAALELAFAAGLPCLQTDDDLQACLEAKEVNGKYALRPLSFALTVARMLLALEEVNCCLAGVAPVSNAFFYSGKPVHRDKFIIASLMVTKPCSLRFDPAFALKEDYDYTTQHLQTYGAVARCSDLMPRYRHYGNAGGCKDYRSSDGEAAAVAGLKAKWPGVFRDNAKRPNEVILRWGKGPAGA